MLCEKDVMYRVTCGNDTLLPGDHFWLDSASGSLSCLEAGGWLDPDDAKAVLTDVIAVVESGWRIETNRKTGRTSATRLP